MRNVFLLIGVVIFRKVEAAKVFVEVKARTKVVSLNGIYSETEMPRRYGRIV